MLSAASAVVTDMNHIIHSCTHAHVAKDRPEISTTEMFAGMAAYLQQLLDLLEPRYGSCTVASFRTHLDQGRHLLLKQGTWIKGDIYFLDRGTGCLQDNLRVAIGSDLFKGCKHHISSMCKACAC